MHKILKSMILVNVAMFALAPMAFGQNWRTPNPDQPNGYRASEAASHYHGNLHAPAQPLNGYHASEARSHYGGSRFEPSSGWNYDSNSGPGSAFSNASVDSGGPGSAYSSQRWYQNGGPQNSFFQRMQRAQRWQQDFHNLSAAGYTPGGSYGAGGGTTYGGGAAQGEAGPGGFESFRNRLSTFAPMMQRGRQLREEAEQNIEDGRGGFNTIYADQR